MDKESNFRTLIYVGNKPDPSFPWGGYHVTITGRTKVPVKQMIDIVRRCIHVFPCPESADDNQIIRGWIPSKESIRGIERQSDGKFMTFLRSPYFDHFAEELTREGAGIIGNIKHNWHISMHDDNEERVQEKVGSWLEEGALWRVYVVKWNDDTCEAEWFPIDDQVEYNSDLTATTTTTSSSQSSF
jgi:hypothetical protein